MFAAYQTNGGAKLVGIVSCAGCPTAVGAGKILEKIRSLVATGVDAIHFANCVATLCPFQNQFKKAIRESFEETELVVGTHGERDRDTVTAFKTMVGDMLCQRRESLADVASAMCYLPHSHGSEPAPEQKDGP
jgi:predicted metal-binding protein